MKDGDGENKHMLEATRQKQLEQSGSGVNMLLSAFENLLGLKLIRIAGPPAINGTQPSPHGSDELEIVCGYVGEFYHHPRAKDTGLVQLQYFLLAAASAKLHLEELTLYEHDDSIRIIRIL